MIKASVIGEGPVVLILHGLFGSKRNWTSISKRLVEQAGLSVHSLDLRNHGESFHGLMNFDLLANDVLRYSSDLENVHLLGHSLGGRVAMKISEKFPNKVSSMILVDISPFTDLPNQKLIEFIRAMKRTQGFHRDAVAKAFREIECDENVVQFLLTNYKENRFIIGLNELEEFLLYENFKAPTKTFEGPVLMVRGEKSDYVSDIPRISRLYPNMQVKTLKTGHWPHFEKPQEFLSIVQSFFSSINLSKG